VPPPWLAPPPRPDTSEGASHRTCQKLTGRVSVKEMRTRLLTDLKPYFHGTVSRMGAPLCGGMRCWNCPTDRNASSLRASSMLRPCAPAARALVRAVEVSMRGGGWGLCRLHSLAAARAAQTPREVKGTVATQPPTRVRGAWFAGL
jgi:hypothetical protein